jgi:predicted nucleic acid-binding protein
MTNAHVLLDTCIINNLFSKETELVSKTQDVLKEVVPSQNSSYVSHFTRYELLRGATEKQILKCEKILSKFVQIENTEDRLNRAVHLYSLYKNNKEVRNHLQSISDVDIFIGSLIFTDKNTYLLTADYCDFPRPFFLETKVWSIEYKRNSGQMSFVYYYLLKANLAEF